MGKSTKGGLGWVNLIRMGCLSWESKFSHNVSIFFIWIEVTVYIGKVLILGRHIVRVGKYSQGGLQ